MANLFSELTIGSMTLRNRTFMAPVSLGYESPDGNPSETQIAYWARRAQAGVGCIITDVTSVDPAVPYLGNTLCFRTEDSIAKHKELTDKLHELGAKVIPQISHPGPESVSAFMGVTPVAPSDYRNTMYQQVRALEKDELPAIVEKYATASYNAKLAGYDGIELHAAHGYMLLGAFLSPLRNKREDEYGGSLMNRARLLFEVIDAIKEKCGKDFPIILRISGSEKIAGGNTVEDVKTLVPLLVEHGIDAFEISGGSQYEMPNKIMPSHGEKEAANLEEAMAIKEVSTVPVILVGKVNRPQLARDLVDGGKVDAVVLGRALLADPDFVQKTEEGRDAEIAPCAGCLVGCVGEQSKRRPGSCVMNPFVGKETQFEVKAADTVKKVVVVGGGVGGMATARMAAIRGHKVSLYEKAGQLGGQINLAAIPPHKEEMKDWITYFANEVERLQVDVHLNHEMNAEELKEMDCDTIIVATGSTPMVFSEGENICSAHAFLKGDMKIPSGKVLIVGGGMVGLETAETINARKEGDLSMVLIEMASGIGGMIGAGNLVPMRARLAEMDLTMMTDTKLVEFKDGTAKVEVKEEEQVLDGFTHLIYAVGSKANNALYEAVKDCGKEVYAIGDAKNVAQALEAVADGTMTALNI